MNAADFEINCGECDGRIKFSAAGVGEQVSCPHCQAHVTLIFPPNGGGSATELTDLYLYSSQFPSKRSELFLLSQFVNFPREANDLRSLNNWRAALDAEPSDVISRFIQRGMLENSSDDLVALLQTKSAKELKDLAIGRGLGKSGTKQVLASRLFESDP